MSKAKVSYSRFVYSIIDFFLSKSSLSFDVSSYIKNDSCKECPFARSKISRFIHRNRKKQSSNRLFLTISLNDTGTMEEGRKIIHSMSNEFLNQFLKSSCVEILYEIDPSASIEVISSMTDYMIILFNVSTCSSIECIVSTDSLTSKLIERDSEGNPIEFHSILSQNLLAFKEYLK